MSLETRLTQLYQLAIEARENLRDLTNLFDDILPVPNKTNIKITNKDLVTKITKEEKDAVFTKLIKLFADKSLLDNIEERLYLEQQISDLTGINVTTNLDGYNLPHTTVKFRSDAHQRTNFADILNNHPQFHEAGLNKKRSVFGWSNQNGHESTKMEEFFIVLPIYLIKAWQTDLPSLVNWFKYRKVLVINPFTQLAAVACVSDVGPSHLQRSQALCSPELSHLLRLWQPGLQGRACLFLIEHSENIPYGQVDIT